MQKSQSARGPTQCKPGQGNNMVSKRNHLLHIFQYNNSPPPRQFLCNKILLKKKSNSKEMHIEQNFELRGPEPHGCICTPITGCFHDKTKILTEKVRLDCY